PGSDPFAVLASLLMVCESGVRLSVSLGSIDSSDLLPPVLKRGLAPEGEDVAAAAARALAENDEESLASQLFQRPETLGVVLHELAAREHCKVLLFVDQMEEAYTMVADGAGREAFVRAVCRVADHPSSPVRAVFTIRDDFLGYLEGGLEVAAALSRVFVLRRPGREGLEEVLARPLASVGYNYDDPRLAAEMVDSVKNEPACLPLIQFAGQMLWDRRDKQRRLLCRATYEAMGGVAGSLAEHADGVLAGMTQSQVDLARQVLLRLVTPAGTRRVVAVSAAVAGLGPAVGEVLDRLTQARLLTVRRAADGKRQPGTRSGGGGGGGSGSGAGAIGSGSGAVDAIGSGIRGNDGSSEAVLELVHESLIRTWTRLARWLEESKEDRVFLAEIGQAAELWEGRGRRPEEVWQGDALREARSKAARLGTALPELVARFLEAGTNKERSVTRRKKALLAMVVTALAAIAVASVLVAQVTVRQKRRAEQREAEALIQRAEAQREGANAALRRGDLLEARAKLRGSLETRDSTMGRILWGELLQDPLVWSKTLGGWLHDVAFSPDGKTVAAACTDGRVHLIDAQTSALRTLRGRVGAFSSVAFSPDGRYLAAGAEAGAVVLWDLAQGSARELLGHSAQIFGLAFDATGEQLASACFDTTVRIWDPSTGKMKQVLRGHEKQVTRVVFGSASDALLSAAKDGTVRQWQISTGSSRVVARTGSQIYGLALDSTDDELIAGGIDGKIRRFTQSTGEERMQLVGHRDLVTSTVLSPDRRALASSSLDRTVLLWDRSTGHHRVLGRHRDIVTAVAFSPDGRLVASGGHDATARLWQVGVEVEAADAEESGHTNSVWSLDYSPDGGHLVSGALDKTVRTWEVRSGRQRMLLRGHQGVVAGVAFSPDGKRIASASHDRSVRVWDLANGGSEELQPRHGVHAWDVVFGSDGRLIASAGADWRVQFWDARTLAATGELRADAVLNELTMSHDGSLVAAAAMNGSVYVWDRKNLKLVAELRGHQGQAGSVVFTNDDRTIISASFDGTIWRWDLASKAGSIVGNRHGAVGRLAISPDGSLVASPGDDGEVRLCSTGTGETRAVWRGHRGGVSAVRFGPDGRLAATCGGDGTVRTWDVATGRPYWRAPALLRSPPRVFTHLGWVELDGK
ncbi:MAG: WD40 repeat domain-containing protein, partial [Pseudomonadota bacterium]